jgi:hypothetical protein
LHRVCLVHSSSPSFSFLTMFSFVTFQLPSWFLQYCNQFHDVYCLCSRLFSTIDGTILLVFSPPFFLQFHLIPLHLHFCVSLVALVRRVSLQTQLELPPVTSAPVFFLFLPLNASPSLRFQVCRWVLQRPIREDSLRFLCRRVVCLFRVLDQL